jgi:hypothetical protein
VLAAVYWIAALVAQLLLTSPVERALPAAARAGIGLLWILTFFSAGWQLFSPASRPSRHRDAGGLVRGRGCASSLPAATGANSPVATRARSPRASPSHWCSSRRSP